MRVKGEVEQRLIALRLSVPHAGAPSGILGPRKAHRKWEARTIRVFHSLRPILPRHYRVVPADKIAKALIEAALTAPAGRPCSGVGAALDLRDKGSRGAIAK